MPGPGDCVTLSHPTTRSWARGAPSTESKMTEQQPSFAHLQRHQRDLQEYKTNVQASADARFGPAWWGIFDQHLSLADDAVGRGVLLAGGSCRGTPGGGACGRAVLA